jgi:hypothetical protein
MSLPPVLISQAVGSSDPVMAAFSNYVIRAINDGGDVASFGLAQAFLQVIYAQNMSAGMVFAGLPAYKTSTDLVDKFYDFNQNDGIGTTTTRPQLIGFSPDFDGLDDFIQIPHNANQLLTGGGCIMAWIRPDSSGASGGRIIDKSTNTAGLAGFFVAMSSLVVGAIQFRINDGTNIVSTENSTPYEQWTHISIVFDENGATQIYINGSLNNSGTTNAASGITTTNAPRIGNRSTSTNRSYDGKIVLPCLFNTQPTQAQIQAIVTQTTVFLV